MSFHYSWNLTFRESVQKRILLLFSSLFIVKLLCCELLSNSRFLLLILFQLSFRLMTMTINIWVISLIARSVLNSMWFNYRLTALRSWSRWCIHNFLLIILYIFFSRLNYSFLILVLFCRHFLKKWLIFHSDFRDSYVVSFLKDLIYVLYIFIIDCRWFNQLRV